MKANNEVSPGTWIKTVVLYAFPFKLDQLVHDSNISFMDYHQWFFFLIQICDSSKFSNNYSYIKGSVNSNKSNNNRNVSCNINNNSKQLYIL